jgi:hypothetical protein
MGARRPARRLRALALLMALGLVAADAEPPRAIAIVVSDRWQELDAIDLATLRSAYLGRRTRLAGMRVRCLHLALGHPIRTALLRALFGRTDTELESYWIEEALSGGALPPAEVASPKQMLALVAAEPGTIGYVDAAELSPPLAPGVRVLAIRVAGASLRPGDAGYPIPAPPAPERRED